jgi:hypothetical protein
MVEMSRGVGSSLIDVTGMPLEDLARLDSDTLGKALDSLMPQHDCGGFCRCDKSMPRLWQNYAPTS